MMRAVPSSASAPSTPPCRLEWPGCNLCDGDSFETLRHGLRDRLLGLGGEWTIERCTSCGLVQTRPRPDRASIGGFYPDVYEVSVGSTPDRRPGSALRILTELRDAPFRLRYGRQRLTPPPHRCADLLEIGCAGGVNLVRYASAGWTVHAVEPSRALGDMAAARAGIPRDRVTTASAEDAEFPAGGFDMIVMFHVIEHLHDPLGVLRKTHRWLRPGGRLEISCPNFGSLERRLFGRFWMGLDLPRHLYHLTPATLTEILSRAGFETSSIVPEDESCTTSLSASAALDALRRRHPPLHARRSVHIGLLPAATLTRVLGAKPSMLVSARPS